MLPLRLFLVNLFRLFFIFSSASTQEGGQNHLVPLRRALLNDLHHDGSEKFLDWMARPAGCTA